MSRVLCRSRFNVKGFMQVNVQCQGFYVGQGSMSRALCRSRFNVKGFM